MGETEQRNREQGKENREQRKGPGRGDRRDSSQGRRSKKSSNTKLYNCDKITTHFANTYPKPKKEEGKNEGRVFPYPRSRESSRDRGSKPGK